MRVLKNVLKQNAKLKHFTHWLMVPKGQARPRLWVQWLVNPFYHKKGKGALIRRRTRIDVLPWNNFELGAHSTIEDFCTINNGVGSVLIGKNCRVGLGSTIIGPVILQNDVRIAQNVVMSGLNHNYQDIITPIHAQGVTTKPIVIGQESWIGANVTIVAGVKIGRHVIVAAGSVVTKAVPDYTVVVGNPARVVKQYNLNTDTWEKVTQVKQVNI